MRLNRRLTAVIVASMMATVGVSSMQAAVFDPQIGSGAIDVTTIIGDGADTSGTPSIGQGATVNTGTATYTNVALSADEGDVGGVEINISIQTDGKILSVQVNGDNVSYDGSGSCNYLAYSSGTYLVQVTDDSGRVTSRSIQVSVPKGNPPTLSVSKTQKNGNWYLIITYADPERCVTSLTVNGNSLNCDPVGDEVAYEINSSGTYDVVVTDKLGNQANKSIYFDVDSYSSSHSSSRPTLSLSKKNRDGKWYLCIKAYDNDDDIRKVTVNGDRIDFDEEGGKEEYRVTESRTYKVEVTDDDGNQTSDELYIDVDVNDKAPELTLTQKYTNNIPYIVIKANDNNKISEVYVNDRKIDFPASGGSVDYRVQEGQSYEVEVVDNNDHVTRKSIYIDYRMVTPKPAVQTPSYNTSMQTVVFTLNSKTWYKNGVVQEDMDVAPSMINNRVCLPLRYAAYALGLESQDITWESRTRTATIIDGSNTLNVTLGSKTMYINGTPMAVDTPAMMVNNHIVLPISQISKAFVNRGINMNWDSALKQVTISSKTN